MNDNIATLLIRTKMSDKDAEVVAQKAEQMYADLQTKLGGLDFGEKLVQQFQEAMDHIKKELKNVNLSTYSSDILESIMSTKSIEEKSKDLEKFIGTIDSLMTVLKPSNRDKTALDSLQPKDLQKVIDYMNKIKDAEKELALQREKYSQKAESIIEKSRKISTIGKDYNSQDYNEILSSLTKSLNTEKGFNSEQQKTIENLAKLLSLYKAMQNTEPEKGTIEAVQYSRDLLTVTEAIKKQLKDIDSFTNKGASAFLKNSDDLKNAATYEYWKPQNAVNNYKKAADEVFAKLQQTINKLQDQISDVISKAAIKAAEKQSKNTENTVAKEQKMKEKRQSTTGGSGGSGKNNGSNNNGAPVVGNPSELEEENHQLDLMAKTLAKVKDEFGVYAKYAVDAKTAYEEINKILNDNKKADFISDEDAKKLNGFYTRLEALQNQNIGLDYKLTDDQIDRFYELTGNYIDEHPDDDKVIENMTKFQIKEMKKLEEQAKATAAAKKEAINDGNGNGSGNSGDSEGSGGSGNTDKLEAGLEEIKTSLVDIKDTLDSINSEDTLGNLSSQLDKVNDKADEFDEKLSSITNKLEEVSSSKTEETSTPLNQVLDICTNIETRLSEIKSIFTDVGDGNEFSPLLATINQINTSIIELRNSVQNIGLNINVDVGSNEELDSAVQAKMANYLQSYEKLFNQIKLSSPPLVTDEFFDFEKTINQYESMSAKISAYQKFINEKRAYLKQVLQDDVLYKSVDKSYWSEVSSAKGQLTKARNSVVDATSNKETPLNNLFGSTDLSGVIEKLETISDKLEEIAVSTKTFSENLSAGLNISTSIEEVDKLTNKIAELEAELEKVKSQSLGDKTNLSSENMSDTVSSSSQVEENLSDIKILTDNFGKSLDPILSKFLALNTLTDKNGNIYRLFHNSPEVFDKFDTSKSGSNQGMALGAGNYLALSQSGEYNNEAYGKYQTQWYALVKKAFDINAGDVITQSEAEAIANKFFGTIEEGFGSYLVKNLLGATASKQVDILKTAAEKAETTIGEIFNSIGYDAIKDGAEINVFNSDNIVRASEAILDISQQPFQNIIDLSLKLHECNQEIQELQKRESSLETYDFSGKTKEEAQKIISELDSKIQTDKLLGTGWISGYEDKDILTKMAASYQQMYGEALKLESVNDKDVQNLINKQRSSVDELNTIRETLKVKQEEFQVLKQQSEEQKKLVAEITNAYLNGTSQIQANNISQGDEATVSDAEKYKQITNDTVSILTDIGKTEEEIKSTIRNEISDAEKLNEDIKERLVLLDKEGNVIASHQGSSSNVNGTFTDEQLSNAEGGKILHSHPGNASFFSNLDLKNMLQNSMFSQIKQIELLWSDSTLSIDKSSLTKESSSTILNIMRNVRKSLTELYTDNQDGIPSKEVREHINAIEKEIFKTISQKLNISVEETGTQAKEVADSLSDIDKAIIQRFQNIEKNVIQDINPSEVIGTISQGNEAASSTAITAAENVEKANSAIAETEQVTKAATKGKEDFAKVNKNVAESADTSAKNIKAENAAMAETAQVAQAAATAKKAFAEANKETAGTATTTKQNVDGETVAIKNAGEQAETTSNDIVEGQKAVQKAMSETEKQARNLADEMTNGRDIISQSGLKEIKKLVDDKGNAILGKDGDEQYEGSFSFLERLQDGQLQRVLMTYNNESKKWDDTILSLNTNFEQVANQIIKADNKINQLTISMEKTKAAHPTYDTSADEELIRLTQKRRAELQKTLDYYAKQPEYESDTVKQQERILANQRLLTEEYRKSQNLTSAKTDEASQKSAQQNVAAITQANRQLAKYEQKIDHIHKTYDKAINPDLEKSVNNQKDLTDLNNKYNEILNKINALKGKKRDANTEQEFLEVEKLIEEYKDLAVYKKRANNPTKNELGEQELNTLVAQEVAAYDKLIAKAEKYGDKKREIVEGLNKLKDTLVSVDSTTNKNSYTTNAQDYYNAKDERKVYSAEFSSWENRYKEAQAVLTKEEESLRNIYKIQTQIIKAESNGKDTTALKEKLKLENENLQQLEREASQYNEFISIQERFAQLKTVKKESSIDLDQAVSNAIAKESEKQSVTNKQKFQAFMQEQAEYEKGVSAINTAIAKTDKLLDNLSMPEGLDSRSQKLLDDISAVNTELQTGQISMSQYTVKVNSLISTYSQKVKQYNKELAETQKIVDQLDADLTNFKNHPLEENQSLNYKAQLKDYEDTVNQIKALWATPIDKRANGWETTLDKLIKKAQEAGTVLKDMDSSAKGSKESSRWGLIRKINEELEKNSQYSKAAKNRMHELIDILADDSAPANVAAIKVEFDKLVMSERNAHRQGKSFLDVLKDKAWYGFAAQIGTYFSFNDLVRYGQQACETVRELDTALGEMRKVSDESVSSLKAFQQTSFDIANTVGTTALEIQNSTADFMRLGYSLDEAGKLAKDANIYANVGDMDIDEATEHMISSIQAWQSEFGSATEASTNIIDRYNEIGEIVA